MPQSVDAVVFKADRAESKEAIEEATCGFCLSPWEARSGLQTTG